MAVKDLNGTYLLSPGSKGHPAIHITTFEIPVVYASVLSEVPPLHFRPPELPESVANPGLPPPPEGYDFILHVGLGMRGGLKLEKRGRKGGYTIPDYEGKLAPVIGPYKNRSENASENQVHLSDVVRHEIERATGGSNGAEPDNPENAVRRGFGERYEEFPGEIWNDVDCDEIAAHLKRTGFEVRWALAMSWLLFLTPPLRLHLSRMSKRRTMQDFTFANLSITVPWQSHDAQRPARKQKSYLFMFHQMANFSPSLRLRKALQASSNMYVGM